MDILQPLTKGLAVGASYALAAAAFALVCRMAAVTEWLRRGVLVAGGLAALAAISAYSALWLRAVAPPAALDALRNWALPVAGALILGFSIIRYASPLGRAQRAVEQDSGMAALLGVNSLRTAIAAFSMAAGLAAAAGIPLAPSLGPAEFSAPFGFGLAIFTAGVLGGFGSVPGAIAAGVLIGLCDTFWMAFYGPGDRDLALFVLLIAVLIFRRSGAPIHVADENRR
jgi:branched-subunit amino acid ABC-type transport system permease component